MYKTVLAPIDLGQKDQAVVVAKTAAKFVDTRGGKLILLNVLPNIPAYIAAEIPEKIFSSGKQQASEDLGKIKVGLEASQKLETVILEGSVYSEIVNFAEESNVDLIVMASHRPELSDYLLGTTAARVVRHANCSVFIIRDRN